MAPFLYEPLEPNNSHKNDRATENTRKLVSSVTNGGIQLSAAASGTELNGYLDELVAPFVKADTKR